MFVFVFVAVVIGWWREGVGVFDEECDEAIDAPLPPRDAIRATGTLPPPVKVGA